MRKDIVDADQLRAFQAVAETGSFTRAAAKLGAAQSSISHQIAQLEKRAGRLLIRRTTRRVQLTPRGPQCSSMSARSWRWRTMRDGS